MINPDVEWRSIPGFPDYEISEVGEIRRLTDHHYLKDLIAGSRPAIIFGGRIRKNKNGTVKDQRYKRVWLHNRQDGKRSLISVHILVCRAFHGPRPTGKHLACHNDGDQFNNHYSNLRWDTPAANTADCRRHGTDLVGARNGQAQIAEEMARKVIEDLAKGIRSPEVARRRDISVRIVKCLKNGDTWKHLPRPPSPHLRPIKPSRSLYA